MHDSNGMVSVIIPCYNAEDYISETLASIKNQTYKNIELIVVDSSDDGTRKIVEHWKKSSGMNLRYYFQEKCGMSAARNLGIEKSMGEYICFIDADDIVCDIFLEILVENINDGVVPFGYYTRKLEECRNVDKLNLKIKKISLEETVDLIMYRKPPVNFWCMLYDAELIREKNLMFSPDVGYGEDGEFMYKYLCHMSSGIFIHAPLNGYRIALTSSTFKKTERVREALTGVRRAIQYSEGRSNIVNSKLSSYLLPRVKIEMAKTFCRQGSPVFFKRLVEEEWTKGDYLCVKANAKDIVVKIANYLINYCPPAFYFILRIYYLFNTV